ncbi:hypothetical protein [Nostoc sp. FACHB-110]|uniref:hypothetical protein n=1 Tax=Nostoc sp. FACHB-110 TaxID=2692834 RepID=UPI001682390F|nr:hypothetical protein [Nostoc sp. FACHB-110]MBD2440733.1 hypothetical protein [Nostoc sp. FACHB-110]
MFKRRTLLACLAALGFTLAVGTKVYGQSASGPDAWQTVYDDAVAGATTIIDVPLLGPLLSLILQIVYGLTGFWGG